MNKQPTIEDMNKVITLFEEMELHTDDPEYGEVFRLKGDKFGISRYPIHELKYHKDWNWLMPVIKKIKEMHMDTLSKCKGAVEGYIKATGKMNAALISIDLQKAHEGVNQFIEWYNQNIKKCQQKP